MKNRKKVLGGPLRERLDLQEYYRVCFLGEGFHEENSNDEAHNSASCVKAAASGRQHGRGGIIKVGPGGGLVGLTAECSNGIINETSMVKRCKSIWRTAKRGVQIEETKRREKEGEKKSRPF